MASVLRAFERLVGGPLLEEGVVLGHRVEVDIDGRGVVAAALGGDDPALEEERQRGRARNVRGCA